MLANGLEFRTSEIENLIAANELNIATKRVMDFVADFAANRKRKQEAIDIRASYIALREESRKYGKTDLENQELSKLRYRVLDFVEVIKEETHFESETTDEESQPLVDKNPKLTLTPTPTTGRFKRTQFEKEKEAFKKQRKEVSSSSDSSNIVFRGKGIKKKYSSKVINFAFELPELELKLGEITSVVGENGNGKTTLLRIIAGELQITDGVLEYPYLTLGNKNDLYSIKQKIAFIPQELPRWSGLLVDNLHFSAAIHGITGEQNEEEVDFIVHRLGLERYRNATWSQISGGYRMRFALAKALVWNPKLIILDEPLANLDINAQQLFLQDLRFLANSFTSPKAVIISSQHLYSMEGITDNIIFIANGTSIYNGKLEDFGKDRDENSFEIGCELSREALTDLFEKTLWNSIDENSGVFTINTPASITAHEILGLLTKHNINLNYFRDISKSTRRLFKTEK